MESIAGGSSIDNFVHWRQGRPETIRSTKNLLPPPSPLPQVDLIVDRCANQEVQTQAEKLASLIASATEILEYWTRTKAVAAGDRETLEAVIQNLSDFIKRDHDLGTAVRVTNDSVDELALHLCRRKLYEGL